MLGAKHGGDMATWVVCKDPIDPTKRIVVNLEQVVAISKVSGGAEIIYAGSSEPITVASSPTEILGEARLFHA